MFRNKFFSLFAFVAVAAGLMATDAQAQNRRRGRVVVQPNVRLRTTFNPSVSFQVRPRSCCYHVYYRTCCSSPWRCYGKYDCRVSARRAEYRLRSRGYQTRIGNR